MIPESFVYTDGSSSPQSRQGGFAALVALADDEAPFVVMGSAVDTTNNRMELIAAVRGLQSITNPHMVYLVSDSAYLLNTIKFKWYERWISENEDRPHMDLWKELVVQLNFHTVQPVKVKGHSGHEYNEWSDRLALYARVNSIEFQKKTIKEIDWSEIK